MQSCGRALKACGVREVVVGGVAVRGLRGVGSGGGGEAEHTLLAMLTTHLHHLTHLSVAGMALTPTQATAFGKVRLFFSLIMLASISLTLIYIAVLQGNDICSRFDFLETIVPKLDLSSFYLPLLISIKKFYMMM